VNVVALTRRLEWYEWRFLPRMLLVACLSVLAASQARADTEADRLLQDRLRAHVEFLAADELRGRLTGTEGYDIAAAYVASQFRQMGLLPAGSEDSYFQHVPLRRAWQEEGSAALSLERGGEARAFEFVEEFYLGPDKTSEESSVSADMVFAGYGIHAPELEYSDYEQLDIAGKIVVTLGGQPLDFPSEEGAHFAHSRERLKAMMARGAVGWVSIHTPRSEKRFQWERVRSRLGMPSMGWLTESGEPFASFPGLRGRATLRHSAAAELFADAPYTLEQLLVLDENGDGLPVFPLPGTLTIRQKSRHENIHSPNVVGLLPGSDPVLGGEYLVYTAHLDHIGELAGDGHTDAINNGAMDNASGIAVMLETARMFAEAGANGGAPRRSILFLAVTAEEKGLVGSEYFAQNPTVPAEAMVAVINLDMPVLLYEFGDVIAFGAEHSTLGEVFRQATADFGITLTPDPFPEQNLFVRSDHYRFVQQGIPSVFLVTGPTSLGGEEDSLAVFEGFLKAHYHRPSDDVSNPINYRAAARFTRINARAGEIVSNRRQRPEWHEGDFFGKTFAR
jgi:Zn-dependent M28 family amino/carboxypeptidase